MEKILQNLDPRNVFKYFEEISQIPRGSENEKEVSDYLYNLAKSKGWDVVQDKALNIIIKKQGTIKGPVVMLQAHMDMVCEKNEDTAHDFKKDPIKLRIVDDYIYATGTTLGADDGIGVAMAIAILDDNSLEHPPLEVLITADEEIGMTGVQNIDETKLDSEILINLDSEEEGIFTTGCAGGGTFLLTIPILKEKTNTKKGFSIFVTGLKGGHSGMDIHLERGNSIKLLGRILYDLKELVQISSFKGGSLDNAIPREAEALIFTDDENTLREKIKYWNEIIRSELETSDSGVEIVINEIDNKDEVLSKDTFEKLLSAISLIPNGVMSKNIGIDLVVSSNNLGVVTTNEDCIILRCLSRSSTKDFILTDFKPQIKMLCDILGIRCDIADIYPGWKYKEKSYIRDLCIKTYQDLEKKEPIVSAIHAGLECGYLLEKMPNLDATSIGPDVKGAHTPQEHLKISSVKKSYAFLCELLKNIRN